MDFLKAEIAAKKRKAADHTSPLARPDQIDDNHAGNTPNHKYIRRGEQEQRHSEERQAHTLKTGESSTAIHQAHKANAKQEGRSRSRNSRSATPLTPEHGEAVDETGPVHGQRRELFNISNDEAIRRLRAKGEPIRLFDENDKERRLRLRALELIEERGEKMGQNDFMRAMRGAEQSMLSRELEGKQKSHKDSTKAEGSGSSLNASTSSAGVSKDDEESSGPERQGVGMNSLLDLGLIKSDIAKVYPIIYYTLKGLLRDWEQSLAERAIEIRQSHQGKLVAATQVQTAEYLKPLFKQLRHRSVKPDVLARLAEIVHYVQKREYRHANDAYLQLSIGNAPWPIGVTMVGIHERSGREKIFSSNVAHVLNDEVSRKYIQSLKRLMTFAQTKYPPENVSMLMG